MKNFIVLLLKIKDMFWVVVFSFSLVSFFFFNFILFLNFTWFLFIFISFYANFDFFFDFFGDLLVIQQRVVQPPYVGIFNSFSPVIEI